MQVIVHGGAGGEPTDPEPRQSVLEDAVEAGVSAETPLDAVEAAVRVLEDSPRFNAGIGSAVQSDGAVRTDAGIMTGDRRVGAVCSVPTVSNAVSAARVVLEETPHVLVAGEHAAALATDYGIDADVDCWSDRTREKWSELDPPVGGPAAHLEWIRERFGRTDPGGRETEAASPNGTSTDGSNGTTPDGTPEHDAHDHDTVGAVARDGDRLAAATSTGGRWLALAGRVGDVPQVGCGFFCTSAGGVSATGAGEDIARVTLSRRVVAHLEDGLAADEAVECAIDEFEDLTDSTAGVIAIDVDGVVGSAYNSDAMQTAIGER